MSLAISIPFQWCLTLFCSALNNKATDSRIFAGENPLGQRNWQLESTGSQRVRHGWKLLSAQVHKYPRGIRTSNVDVQWNLRHLKEFPNTNMTNWFLTRFRVFNLFKKKYIVLKKLFKHCTCKSKRNKQQQTLKFYINHKTLFKN